MQRSAARQMRVAAHEKTARTSAAVTMNGDSISAAGTVKMEVAAKKQSAPASSVHFAAARAAARANARANSTPDSSLGIAAARGTWKAARARGRRA
jgi:hypothetical protein